MKRTVLIWTDPGEGREMKRWQSDMEADDYVVAFLEQTTLDGGSYKEITQSMWEIHDEQDELVAHLHIGDMPA